MSRREPAILEGLTSGIRTVTFEGIYTPAVTPFTAAGEIDRKAFAEVLESLVVASVHGIIVGGSLLAPHVRYPDHNHGPEEVYLVLSPGRFQHGESGWFEPGIGGTLYNEPGIRHAMASDDAPLFALWYLWTGRQA